MKILKIIIPLLLLVTMAEAQELEPRRWSHLPMNINFAAASYTFTQKDILLNPVLELKDVTLDMQTLGVSYVRTFELLGRSARVDLIVPYKYARWEGLIQGEPSTTSRQGLGDPVARLSINLIGGPPLKAAEFAKYNAEHRVRTLVGIGLTVSAPLGDYQSDKLLNLGSNRFGISPALGVIHERGNWTGEATGSVWFFTDNNDFYGGKKQEQNPLPMVQTHLIYTFKPGIWAGASAGYAYGGESHINGVTQNDSKENIGGALSFGYSFNQSTGIKLAYAHTETLVSSGFDSDSLILAISVMW
jgi:hypothetical protein